MASSKPRGKALASVRASTAARLQEERDQRALDAYRLRQKGKDWWEIAEAMKITPAVAKEAVAEGIKAAAEMVSGATKSELLQLEVARLDALQNAVWPDAIMGEPRAVAAARGIIMDRAKLLRLDADENVSLQQNTVVVTGTSATYVEALRSIASYDPAADTEAFPEDTTA